MIACQQAGSFGGLPDCVLRGMGGFSMEKA